MIEKWSDELNTYDIDIIECSFSCESIKLPILINRNTNSVDFMVQLRHIYSKYVDFMDAYLNIVPGTSYRIEDAPYKKVLIANEISNQLYIYISSLGLVDFAIEDPYDYNDMGIRNSTPICSRVFYNVLNIIEDIEFWLRSNQNLYNDSHNNKNLNIVYNKV